MEYFRFLIEAPKLSLYGASYGTTVMATYATMFPHSVDLLILDSSVYVKAREMEILKTNLFFLCPLTAYLSPLLRLPYNVEHPIIP